jgi:hypothetical protein
MPRRVATRSPAAVVRAARGVPALPSPLRTLATVIAFAIIAAVVSFPLADPDLWQHLVTGRAIWAEHRLPATNVWTWPSYGAPYVIPSWLFRVAVWPFYAAGGVTGLFVWRWLTTLVAFALLAFAARARREAGATGVATLCVLVWCAMLYRFRSQVRPETLVAVLLAGQLALFEWRRNRWSPERLRFDPAWLTVPLVVVWTNAHLSFLLGLFITGAYLLDDLRRARAGAPAASSKRLALVLAASAAATLLNPWGWTLVRQPFEFALVERYETAYRMISELGPIPWGAYLPTGLPLLLASPVLLALVRWRKRGPDLAELTILGAFIVQGVSSQRFIGFTALAIAPFFARDLSELVSESRVPAPLARPAARTAIAGTFVLLLLVPVFQHRGSWPKVAFRESAFPVAACDAIAARDVRGRAFNLFSYGGYILWRFWPERDRLPFIDVHLTGSPALRDAYVSALIDSSAWAALDREDRFEWVLLPRTGQARAPLLEWLDADTTRWSLVFRDDVAALYVKRGGTNAAVAERDRYRWLGGGVRRLDAASQRMFADSVTFTGVIAELNRSVNESRWSANSHLAMGNLAAMAHHWQDALAQYDAAAATAPDLAGLAPRRAEARDSVAARALNR